MTSEPPIPECHQPPSERMAMRTGPSSRQQPHQARLRILHPAALVLQALADGTPSSPCRSQKPGAGPIPPSSLPTVAGLAVTSLPQLLSPPDPYLPHTIRSLLSPMFSKALPKLKTNPVSSSPPPQLASGSHSSSPAWLSGAHRNLASTNLPPSLLSCHLPPPRFTVNHSHAPDHPPPGLCASVLAIPFLPQTLPLLSHHRALFQAALWAWPHPSIASSLSQ